MNNWHFCQQILYVVAFNFGFFFPSSFACACFCLPSPPWVAPHVRPRVVVLAWGSLIGSCLLGLVLACKEWFLLSSPLPSQSYVLFALNSYVRDAHIRSR
jgi:hypothetical protein